LSIFAFMDSIWGAVGVGKDSKGKSPFNNTYDSIVGNTTVFTIGAGTTVNTYSSSMTAITDLQEMFRLFGNLGASDDESDGAKIKRFLANHIIYNSGGGQTLYLFGPNKAIGYRLSQNFTSDRYYKANYKLTDDKSKKRIIEDITWQPKEDDGYNNRLFLIPAMLFSLSLLIWDLCIVYKMKTASSVEGVDTSIGGDSSPNSKASNANITALLIYEHVYIQFLEVFERLQCAVDTSRNEANDAQEEFEKLQHRVTVVESVQGYQVALDEYKTIKDKLEKTKQFIDTANQEVEKAKQNAKDAVSNIKSVIADAQKATKDAEKATLAANMAVKALNP